MSTSPFALQFLPECVSTNNYALQLIAENATEGTAILTDFQTGGRGQQGSKWESEKGKNLLMSIILRPTWLQASQSFALNMLVANAIVEVMENSYALPALVKWPNDIFLGSKKLGGVLIENSIQGEHVRTSIIGLGLNVNQTHFLQAPNAVSLKQVLGVDFEINTLATEIIKHILYRYSQIQVTTNYADEETRYLNNLFGLNENRQFTAAGKPFEGIIKGVDEWGRLQIATDNGLLTFGNKEVGYLM